MLLYSYVGHTCKYPGCKKVFVLDGNMKNRRDVCMARDAGYTEYEGLPGSIKTGCMNTPNPKSRYCNIHRVCICGSKKTIDKDEDTPSLSSSHGGVVERILERRTTRNANYYKVHIVITDNLKVKVTILFRFCGWEKKMCLPLGYMRTTCHQ